MFNIRYIYRNRIEIQTVRACSVKQRTLFSIYVNLYFQRSHNLAIFDSANLIGNLTKSISLIYKNRLFEFDLTNDPFPVRKFDLNR